MSTKIDHGEVDAVFAAIRQLADEEIPPWERGMVSDDLLRSVATAAVTASTIYRQGKGASHA